jgi:hypothetical protein
MLSNFNSQSKSAIRGALFLINKQDLYDNYAEEFEEVFSIARRSVYVKYRSVFCLSKMKTSDLSGDGKGYYYMPANFIDWHYPAPTASYTDEFDKKLYQITSSTIEYVYDEEENLLQTPLYLDAVVYTFLNRISSSITKLTPQEVESVRTGLATSLNELKKSINMQTYAR